MTASKSPAPALATTAGSLNCLVSRLAPILGAQKFPAALDELEYGVSITDGCLDWETTEAALRETHAALGL